MEYTIIKMSFPHGVHLGQHDLEDAGYELYADTFFSALCTEIVKQREEQLEWFVEKVRTGELVFSDAFPYIGDIFYLPRPVLQVENKDYSENAVETRKVWKNLSYLPYDDFEDYLNGEIDSEGAKCLKEDFSLGNTEVRTHASVTYVNETKPYRVGSYHFQENCGLYVIVGYQNDEIYQFFKEMLVSLSYSGIGGRKSAGYGRFTVEEEKVPVEINERLSEKMNLGKTYMTLSVSLPLDEELDKVLETAYCVWIKRSGFVTSLEYSKSYRRRQDLYVMKSGSCVKQGFKGNIYDVSDKFGNHPVYRYAMPMFLEV